jgi:hypothetical protein
MANLGFISRFMRTKPTPAIRRSAAPRPPTLRSRVTNGKSLFVRGGDGRGPWARRMRDIIEMHVSDLGGTDVCSGAELSIIRRAATLTVELERIEARFATGKGDDALDLYQKTSGSLRRLLESIGLKRRPRDVQTIEQYLASKTYPDEPDEEEPGDGTAAEVSEADSASEITPDPETALPVRRSPAGVLSNRGRSP